MVFVAQFLCISEVSKAGFIVWEKDDAADVLSANEGGLT